ncbi:hypothetical protein BCR39DRAFT_550650 [Naematelia encephala]|uniref:Peptide hydrolase n=1 Tax=Naematelia encephala TaxID=71784 RepID=A0A1Y2AJT1_9TREE|nr:hypothetical protein BCR39DRAFT_550650 [Naematelia encephala]
MTHSHRKVRSGGDADIDQAVLTPWTSWLLLLPVFTLLPYLLSIAHYQLPEPLPPWDALGKPQVSEELVLKHIKALETIGYRTVGTPQALQGEEYVIEQVRKLEAQCDVLKCEVWVQKGDGFHAFNILDHEVLKVYKGIRNVILKISSRSTGGKDAILLGAHIDSTLPAPGAADDGMGVGVMLEVARVLIERNEPFDNSIIFMWNGGEETLQDGSHLYSTQHETAKDVRAMINLEAAGSMGGALLFQATSAEMIDAYSHAPYPRGTVIAADVFSSGIIMSDTDFGQFEQYLNVSGLDMAIVGHSYYYHTRKDTLANIERGSAQHFASNILPIVEYLLSPSSPLSSSEPFHPPDMVYMSLYDRIFVTWSMETGDKVYLAIASVVAVLTVANVRWNRWKPFAVALLSTPVGLIVGLVTANAVAGLMVLLKSRLAWFSHERMCLLLYIPAAYTGHLGTQLVLSRILSPADRTLSEHNHYYAQLVFSAFSMLVLQAFRVRSAYIFAVFSSVMIVGAIISATRGKTISYLAGHVVPLVVFMTLGMEAVTLTFDIFTPLVGRMGKVAPAEFIIATISASNGFIFFPTLIPLFHRLPRRAQKIVVTLLALFTLTVVAVFSSPWWSPYDAAHPKRMAVQYTYNHTSGEPMLHMAFMDSGDWPGIIEAVAERYAPGETVEYTVEETSGSDWDVIYPVSSFLETYRVPLPHVEFDWPKLSYEVSETSWKDGIHRFKLRADFTGLVFPTLTVDADIVDWSFEFEPPSKKTKHHFKVATSIDDTVMEIELAVRAEKGEKTTLSWSGIDLNQMVPGTALERGPDMPASKLLLDMDKWATEKWNDSLEILMYGAVTGVLEI